MKRNERLKQIRTSRNLSFEELSILTKIPKWKLKRYELGYFKITKKVAEKLAVGLEVEPDYFLEDKKGYPYVEDENTSVDIYEVGAKRMTKPLFMIINAIVSLGTLIVAIIGLIKFTDMASHSVNYAPPEYANIYSQVYNSNNRKMAITLTHLRTTAYFYYVPSVVDGQKVRTYISPNYKDTDAICFDIELYHKFGDNFPYEDYSSIPLNELDLSNIDFGNVDISKAHTLGELLVLCANHQEIDTFAILEVAYDFVIRKEAELNPGYYEYLSFDFSVQNQWAITYTNISDNAVFTTSCFYDNGKFNGLETTGFIGNEVFVRQRSDKAEQLMSAYYSKAMPSLDKYLNEQYGINKGLQQFTLDYQNIQYNYYGQKFLWLIVTLVTTAVFLLSFLFLILSLVFKRKFKVYGAFFRRDFLKVHFHQNKFTRELPENITYTPFFKELPIRYIGVLLLLLGNLGLFFTVASITGTYGLSGFDYKAYKEGVQGFQLCGIVILTVISIDIISKGTNIVYKATTFFFAGILYYVAMTLIMYELSFSYSQVFLIGQYFVPGNIPLWLACVAWLSYFLLTTPKYIDTPSKTIFFRLAALLPAGYMIATMVMQFVDIQPYYIKNLMPVKKPFLTLFTLSFILCLFLTHIFAKYRYGEENFSDFIHGNIYLLLKNIYIVVILAILITVSHLTYQTDASTVMGLSDAVYVVLVLPILICYHPRIEPRNSKADLLYLTTFILSYVVPIGLSILPLLELISYI